MRFHLTRSAGPNSATHRYQDVGLWLARQGASNIVSAADAPRSARAVYLGGEKKMPKMSRATAASHMAFPGYVDEYEQEIGDWTVTIESNLTDLDQAPLFKGAPDDRCQASHVGYVLTGKFGIRRADGVEEIFEAGDAFVIEPGHTPLAFAGGEFVAFTPSAEAGSKLR